MTRFLTIVLVSLLALLQIDPLQAQNQATNAPAILEIRVLEGEGAVYPIGARATRGLTVLVTDETGRPVPGATVSFTLPSGGPGGVFSNGGTTEIVTTQGDGRAAVWGMQWNRTSGQFEIRITAVKGQARAGTISSAYLNDAPALSTARTRRPPKEPGGGHKWLWIGLAVGGAAAAGAVGWSTRSPSSTAASSSSLAIGSPTITLGHQ